MRLGNDVKCYLYKYIKKTFGFFFPSCMNLIRQNQVDIFEVVLCTHLEEQMKS